MIVVVITGGTVKCEDGNGLYMVVEVDVSMGGLPVSVEPGDGGCEGNGAEGKPDVTVPGCVGIQAIPAGPTSIVVDTPSIVVISEEVPVNVVNGASVEAVKVTSVVLEPSMAVIVITVLDGI